MLCVCGFRCFCCWLFVVNSVGHFCFFTFSVGVWVVWYVDLFFGFVCLITVVGLRFGGLSV